MARAPRDPRLRRDRIDQRPLLQGHLRKGGRPAPASAEGTEAAATPEPPAAATPERPAQPASEVSHGEADVVRGKATRSPAEVSKRRNLEGSEQGPV